ncbi:MAG: M23 family metallopeptidase [Treponema sp.]|nr:M23 family metallopeptidase [Treponema sp.]
MSSLLRSYKKLENEAWKRLTARFLGLVRGLRAAWLRFVKAAGQEITILVVPHTEAPARGLHIPLAGLVAGCFLTVGVLVGGVLLLIGVRGEEGILSGSSAAYTAAKSEHDQLQDQMGLFTKAFGAFKSTLVTELSSVGRGSTASLAGAAGFPFAKKALFSSQRVSPLQELEEARATLDAATVPIEEYGNAIAEMDQIKPTVPAIWPIEGGMGHISFPFGPEPNPFTGEMYFHTGIDCSTYRTGDPIVATADGTVEFAGVDGGYGRCVYMKHANGYYTRYGHMERILVYTGQKVKQGQVIGLIGMTGVATGPHVHYEVIIGSAYVDPMGYFWSNAQANPIVQGGHDHD